MSVRKSTKHVGTKELTFQQIALPMMSTHLASSRLVMLAELRKCHSPACIIIL